MAQPACAPSTTPQCLASLNPSSFPSWAHSHPYEAVLSLLQANMPLASSAQHTTKAPIMAFLLHEKHLFAIYLPCYGVIFAIHRTLSCVHSFVFILATTLHKYVLDKYLKNKQMSCERHWLGLPRTQPVLCGFSFVLITPGHGSHREDTHLNQPLWILPSISVKYSDGQH